MVPVRILIASTPANGDVDPMLAISRLLMGEGHEIAFYTASAFRARIEASGAVFFPLSGGADFDPADPFARIPELKVIPPGLEWLRVALERIFVDNIPLQHEGMQKLLLSFDPDVIVGDDMFFGVPPMLFGADAKRPPVVLCATSFLHWPRQDGAPSFLGPPLATTSAVGTRPSLRLL
jgi:hypothetical protein